jgi:hypothetical protein
MMRRRVISRVIAASAVCAVAVSFAATAGGSASAASSSAPNVGIGSAAALNSPNCDKASGRLKMQFYGVAPCVKPFSGSNGGATTQGVTKNSILIVVLAATEAGDLSPQNGGIKNYATGTNGRTADAFHDEDAIFAHFYETYGRTVKYEYVTATGADEASQRADAVTVLAKKPFAVIDSASQAPAGLNGGGVIFDEAIAAAKLPGDVPVLTNAQTYAPYEQITGEFVAKDASKGKAVYAGDALKNTTRKIGVIYPQGTDQGIDLAPFNDALKKYGGTVAAQDEVPYTVPTDATQLASSTQQQAPTIIAKLKSDGVTTIVDLGIGNVPTVSFTKEATSENYFPEWIPGGLGYTDLDFYGRSYDQQQWAHAFYPEWFPPTVESGPVGDAITTLFQWYWGTNQGTHSPGIFALIKREYDGIMLAGPTLNASTFAAGLKSFPPVGGAFSNQITNLETGWETPALTQRLATAIGWWNPNVTGPSNQINIVGQGKTMYLNGGKRYKIGAYPTSQTFFSTSNSIVDLPSVPQSDKVGPFTCSNCPSTGGGQTPGASSS